MASTVREHCKRLAGGTSGFCKGALAVTVGAPGGEAGDAERRNGRRRSGERTPIRHTEVVPDAIAPDGSEITLLVTEARRASLVEVRLPAGRTSLPVRHRTVEEISYFLAGRGRVWRRPPEGEGMVEEVGPGSVLTIPTGWTFQFQAGDEDLRFLCYTSPPWPGDEEAERVEITSPLASAGRPLSSGSDPPFGRAP